MSGKILAALSAVLMLCGCSGPYPGGAAESTSGGTAADTEVVEDETTLPETMPPKTESSEESAQIAEMPDPFATSETTEEEEHPFMPV